MKYGALISPEALETEDFTAHVPGVPMVLFGEHALDVPIDHVGIGNVRAAHLAVRTWWTLAACASR